ncbi:TetR family transcriptional regulator [Nocardiopsis terrae]|uniref:AcrR family transcriptional regulator n=1 Tax=Nocardiopsis terrae TaxID=372655 RepID=A0ABR9HET9_9ACTN|nr:TetR/AcrR family transcriptional regulator [Nocardiopsis terrae]MBE1457502.1 AcrR family transcriptional regulator [Nocardiopsis terrae]GHC85790.1 TetR family transcriptional regulator [Nocardiopsis terrae]
MANEKTRGRLTAGDWARAALTAIGDGGIAAVAVEPIAARLGATKGSFYWHFANRDALVEAALRLWEQQHTEAVIARVEEEPDARARIRRLFLDVTTGGTEAVENRIEVALLAAAAHPLVAPAVGRVTERRIAYVADLYEELGVPPAPARRHALLAFTTWMGHTQLVHAAPGVLPTGEDASAYLDFVLDSLVDTGERS